MENGLFKKAIPFLLTLMIPFQSLGGGDKPNFIINVIARVPNTFQRLLNVEDYKAAVEQLPYYIEKATRPIRGKIVIDAYALDQKARGASSILAPFFDKISKQSFSETDEVSEGAVSDRVRVSILLNRMKSVYESENSEFYNVVDDLPQTIEHRIISCLWEPQWIRKDVTKTGQVRHTPVNLSEVSAYYERLKAEKPILADAFLQINEHQALNSIVPYRELREVLLKDEATKSLVRASRAHSPKSPVYIAFMDGDVISLRTGQKGVFSYYEEKINKSEKVFHGLTTGYCVSVSQNPFASLSVALDLAQRQALSTVFPLAPYYPEPNAIIRVLDGYETLEVSFPGIKLDRHSSYTSPQELPLLIKEVVRCRFQGSNFLAAPHFMFIQEGAIETEAPARFLQNRKKKDGTKNEKMFSGEFSEETNQFASITQQDLTKVRNTSQSHLKSVIGVDMFTNIWKNECALKALQLWM